MGSTFYLIICAPGQNRTDDTRIFLANYLSFLKDWTISSPLNFLSTESGARGGVIVGLTR